MVFLWNELNESDDVINPSPTSISDRDERLRFQNVEPRKIALSVSAPLTLSASDTTENPPAQAQQTVGRVVFRGSKLVMGTP
ncbi:hypothetical protein PCANC_15886 [Puccinia coronata f. sp. avenae]|uniref:Uncharacterized protein n=1 Tax=Puccinia coronata f. sp. avenae TaxID=200324 RepID=A0A2N5UAY9_9BASI|nr:hypothetical protein PCANC_27842 [Puccinia coronata f. sp. avenae]PLW34878.1 hypothetical protein PCASD_15047 [Puccinia coronata f. sp. avenae]PLW38897.1 hypothetical protein PCANC_15886 [Puccinia coronata f. sp. avenae]